MRHRRARKVLGAVVVGSLLLAGAALASGRIAYVTTRGVSMFPRFRTGDLVILKKSESYHVGEIVAYHSPVLHSIVLHRIVGEEGGLFTFKGDNNNFDDPVSLPASSIVGTDFVNVPHKLAFVTWTPGRVEVLVFLVFLGGLAAMIEPHRRRMDGPGGHPRAPEAGQYEWDRSVWLISGGIGVCVFGALAGVALGVPGSLLSTQAVPYRESVTFAYSASTRPDTTYPTGQVTTGTPVFLNLVDSVLLRADFRLDSTAPVKLQGTISFTATVAESDGWSHVLTASPTRRFTGSQVSVGLNVPLKQAIGLAQAAASETGVAQGAESVVVSPDISLRGTIDGQPFKDTLNPRLTFQLSPLELSLLPGSDTGGQPEFPQLVDATSGQVHRQFSAPSGASVLGVSLVDPTGVVITLGGLLMSLAASGYGFIGVWRRRDTTEEERALRRIGRDIVPISSDPSDSVEAVVDVATVSALAGLAERFEVGLLDYRDGSQHVYFAPIGELLYRCRPAPAPRSTAATSAVRVPDRRRTTTKKPVDRARHAPPAATQRARRSRKARLSLIPAQADLETYDQLLTYGTQDPDSDDRSLRSDPLLSHFRPRILSRHGSGGAHSASRRAKRAS